MADRPYKPGPSAIHGLGVIATRLIRKGTKVNVNLIADSRGFNHSCDSNLSGHALTGDMKYRMVLRDIQPNEELTVDYRDWGRPKFICNCPICRKENV